MPRRPVLFWVLLFTLPFASGAAQFGDFTYTSDGVHITITDYTGTGGAVAIPDTIEGLPVAAIGNAAFYFCNSLKSVTIPDNVKTIGDNVFYYCAGLTSVTLGNGVATIGNSAFYHCTNLTSVRIPESVTTIGDHAFGSCASLPGVTIPDSVTTIGDYAFADCNRMTTIVVGAANTQYSSLDGVLFNKSQTTLMQYPAGKVGGYAIPAGVIMIANAAFSSCSDLTDVIIPESVTTIESDAFSSCTGLTHVKIPSSVTTIDYQAFSSCSGLTSVLIPDSVTSIGYGAFGGCTSLTDIAVDVWNAHYSSLDGVLFDKSQTTLVQYPAGKAGTYAIPDHVTSIWHGAFFGCSYLTGVTIPDSVTFIGGGGFYRCTSLTSVTIPDSVTFIGGLAFGDCYGLTHVTIGDGVTSIGDLAFNSCTGLTSVTIGKGVTSIGVYTFGDCDKLTSVSIPDSVISIGYSAFASCNVLTSVSIGKGIRSIGDRAFSSCPELRRFYFTGDYISPGGSMFDPHFQVTVYYLPGTTGWTSLYAWQRAQLWNPRLTNLTPATGTPGMSFTVTGTPEIPIAVEVTSNLLAGPWTRLSTTTVPPSGAIDFTDPDAADQPVRFYRVVGP